MVTLLPMLGIPCSQDALRARPGADKSMPWAVATSVHGCRGGSGPRWAVGMEILVAYGTDMTLGKLTGASLVFSHWKLRLFCIWSSDLGVLQGPNLTFAEENPALSETISWTVQEKTSHTWCSIGKTKISCFFNYKKNVFLGPSHNPTGPIAPPTSGDSSAECGAVVSYCANLFTPCDVAPNFQRKHAEKRIFPADSCHMLPHGFFKEFWNPRFPQCSS